MDIKAIRKRFGLSQIALAQLLRLHDRKTIKRWERGERIPGPASILLELIDAGELPARYWKEGKP